MPYCCIACSLAFKCKKAVGAEVKGVKRTAVEGRSELCLNTKAPPSSTGAGRMERLMHDNEKISSGTFTK